MFSSGPSPDGFAGIQESGIGGMLEKSDENRKRAIAAARKRFPNAMVQGDLLVEKRGDNNFVIVGKLDEATLEEGLIQPGRKTVAKPTGPKVLPSRSNKELSAELDEYRKTKYGVVGTEEIPDLGETPPRPGLNNGDELSREINQTNLNSFVKQLEKGDKDRGMAPIQFRHGFNSNDLPGSDGTYSHGDANIMGQRSVLESRAVMSPEGLEVLIDGNNVSFPQSGVSPIADEADSARAVPVPGRQKLEGLSARSRAFLDHEGGILGALRAAEASQGYVRQGGKNYAITGEDDKGNYTFTEFNDKGLRELKGSPSSTINHEFMDTYQEGDRPTPDQAQSPEINFTTKADLETMSPQRETPVAFGVGDGSVEQLIDFPDNFEKMVLDPVDWMSRYRDLKIS
tara:strand:+ start:189 stop:1385 length:1197 start_codon:yes stop_codon:yes gene_type:complete